LFTWGDDDGGVFLCVFGVAEIFGGRKKTNRFDDFFKLLKFSWDVTFNFRISKFRLIVTSKVTSTQTFFAE
jgi:hypothetical protein